MYSSMVFGFRFIFIFLEVGGINIFMFQSYRCRLGYVSVAKVIKARSVDKEAWDKKWGESGS